MKLKIIEKIAKEHPFNSRSWNYQKVIRYLLGDENNRIIEAMVIWHLKDGQIVEFILELSNMYNCPVGCQFCASGALKNAPYLLTVEDFWEQINIMLSDNEIDPNNYEKFCISFTGIGEPSIVYKQIGQFMSEVQKKYSHVTFIIGTFGYEPKCFEYWKNLNLRIKTLQLPFYSSDNAKLRKIVKNLPSNYSFYNNVQEAIKYKENTIYNKCRVKINMLGMQGINDSDEQVDEFIKILSPIKNKIEVRISFLNYTKQAEKYGYISPSFDRLREIEKKLKENGFEAYSFGNITNEEIGCGQLVQNKISSEK